MTKTKECQGGIWEWGELNEAKLENLVDKLMEEIYPEQTANDQANELLKMKKRPDLYIIWATSGVGAWIAQICQDWKQKRDFYPIWSRNLEKIKKISEWANEENFCVPWDIFDSGSEAYKFIIEKLPQKSGVVQFLSSIDMDPISKFKDEIDPRNWKEWAEEISGQEREKIRRDICFNPENYGKIKRELDQYIIKDAIDPRTWKEWDENIFQGMTDEEAKKEYKKKIRKEMADSQINLWENFLKSLLNRESKELLTIVFVNSVIAKYFESSFISSNSEYGRLKNTISKMIEKYRPQLEAKNVFIKNIFLGVADTPMLEARWPEGARNTWILWALLWPNLPLDWEELVAAKPLASKEVSRVIYEIGNMDPNATPNRIVLYKEEHLDNKNTVRKHKEKVKKIISKSSQSRKALGIKWDLWKNTEVEITDEVKELLKGLRQKSLEDYLDEKYPEEGQWDDERKAKEKMKKKLEPNMNFADEIIGKLPEKVSLKSFVDICLRIEGNYP